MTVKRMKEFLAIVPEDAEVFIAPDVLFSYPANILTVQPGNSLPPGAGAGQAFKTILKIGNVPDFGNHLIVT